MATINLNVKVVIGPRTETFVDVYSTSSKVRPIKLKNGTKITDQVLADWIAENLTAAIKKAGGEL